MATDQLTEPAFVVPPSADDISDIIEDYKAELKELTFNSRQIIMTLTEVAGENLSCAEGIVSAICTHILEAPPSHKLPSLYLMDSIVKNVGGVYVGHFAKHLSEVFLACYDQVDVQVKSAMMHLFQTWTANNVFPSELLLDIEDKRRATIRRMEPVTPVSPTAKIAKVADPRIPGPSAGPVATTSGSVAPTVAIVDSTGATGARIHVNPKYLEARRYKMNDQVTLPEWQEPQIGGQEKRPAARPPQQPAMTPLSSIAVKRTANGKEGGASAGRVAVAIARGGRTAGGRTGGRSAGHVAGGVRAHVAGPLVGRGGRGRSRGLDMTSSRPHAAIGSAPDKRAGGVTRSLVADPRLMPTVARNDPRLSAESTSARLAGRGEGRFQWAGTTDWHKKNGTSLEPFDSTVRGRVAEERLGNDSDSDLPDYNPSLNPEPTPQHTDSLFDSSATHQRGTGRARHLSGTNAPRNGSTPAPQPQVMPQMNWSQLQALLHSVKTEPQSINGQQRTASPQPNYPTPHLAPPRALAPHPASSVTQLYPPAPLAAGSPPPSLAAGLPNLISSLFEQGLITIPSRSQPSVSQTSLPALNFSSAFGAAPAATAVPAAPISREINTRVLRGPHKDVIRSLYDSFPYQCAACGLRLKVKEDYSTHLDRHFQTTKERKSKKGVSRPWYILASDWLAGPRAREKGVGPTFAWDEPAQKRAEPEDEPSKYSVVADEDQRLCALCHEEFEEYYDQEGEQWMYRGAVYTDEMLDPSAGRIVHAACTSHVIPNSKDDQTHMKRQRI